MLSSSVLLASLLGAAVAADPTIEHSRELSKRSRAVIGILTIPPSAAEDNINYSTIDSSYVRWLQGAGALVVPILFNDTAANIEALYPRLSGVLFTGGPDKPTDFNRYMATATMLYNMSLSTGMPLWGTCLGFQSISDIVAGGVDVLYDVDATHLELPLELTAEAASSRLFRDASPQVMASLTKHAYTTNWHHYGVSPDVFSSSVAPAGFVALSTNVDTAGLPFVSTMEHATAPIYATQWHPEANAHDMDHSLVDHSSNAVATMQYIVDFFVSEARSKGLGHGDVGDLDGIDIESYPLVLASTGHSRKYVFA